MTQSSNAFHKRVSILCTMYKCKYVVMTNPSKVVAIVGEESLESEYESSRVTSQQWPLVIASSWQLPRNNMPRPPCLWRHSSSASSRTTASVQSPAAAYSSYMYMYTAMCTASQNVPYVHVAKPWGGNSRVLSCKFRSLHFLMRAIRSPSIFHVLIL